MYTPQQYGSDCNTPCGQCRGDVWNNVTGHCPHGCKPNWNGKKCDGNYILTLKCHDGYISKHSNKKLKTKIFLTTLTSSLQNK